MNEKNFIMRYNFGIGLVISGMTNPAQLALSVTIIGMLHLSLLW